MLTSMQGAVSSRQNSGDQDQRTFVSIRFPRVCGLGREIEQNWGRTNLPFSYYKPDNTPQGFDSYCFRLLEEQHGQVRDRC